MEPKENPRAASESQAHVPEGIRDVSRYSLELESLRGAAVLLVVVFHASGIVIPSEVDPGPVLSFIYSGHTGVSLFFVLSAFLLSRPFIVEARGGSAVSWKSFWSRRALRILPLYACAVLVGTAMHAESAADLLNAIPYLFFLNALPGFSVDLFPYSNVWWSLATEAQFYVVLPFAALCFRSAQGRIVGTGLLCWYAVMYVSNLSGSLPSGVHMRLANSLFGRAPAFIVGVWGAWFYYCYGEAVARWGARSKWIRNGAGDVVLFGVLLALGELLARVSVMGYFDAEILWHEWHVMESLLWIAVVLLVLMLPLRTKALFSNRILGWFGLLSYSIYLIHLPIFWRIVFPASEVLTKGHVGWTRQSMLAALAAFAVVIALSLVTYRLIELPVLRRKAKVGATTP